MCGSHFGSTGEQCSAFLLFSFLFSSLNVVRVCCRFLVVAECDKFARLSTVEREPVLCAGLDIPCDGNQCCGGYPFINSLTFPRPNADESFAGCPTTRRYTDQEETLAASEPVKCPATVGFGSLLVKLTVSRC